MTKNCKHCSNEFEQKTNKGHEQLYCSNTCAQQAARLRREERIKNSVYANKQENEIPERREGATENCDMAQRAMGGTSTTRWNNSPDVMATIEKLYESKIENNYLKLRCENLEEKVKQLENEIMHLNSEIEAMEIDEELDEQQGFLGGIMQQFKTDPINTIALVKMMFENVTAKNENNDKKQKTATATA